MPLTSLANHRVKLVRALQSQRKAREAEGRFVIEGVRLVEEALGANAAIDFAFYTAEADGRVHFALDHLRQRNVPVLEASPSVMRACADTEHPQAVLAVVSNLQSLIFNDSGLKIEDLLLICDRISDPGNLGALLRSAAAAGAAAWLAPGTADAFNPKVVRAGMGAHFRLPIESLEWDTISPRLAGLQVLLADAEDAIHDSTNGKRQTMRYDLVDWTQPSAVIVSNEADGPSPAARACAIASVFIPMPGGGESLNAAIAGSVILFEAVRQRLGKRQS